MFQWEAWKNPEWIHLLISALGVRFLRTLGFQDLASFLIVIILGFLYELIVYIFTGHKISFTDLIADFLGCFSGVLI